MYNSAPALLNSDSTCPVFVTKLQNNIREERLQVIADYALHICIILNQSGHVSKVVLKTTAMQDQVEVSKPSQYTKVLICSSNIKCPLEGTVLSTW